ncbi:hypothetical protein PCASD_26737 [Puccinia coronata f. sp. avenae]|uniref:Uncharacterized protein n=1 Tax=Puccinia coronata f. sp. avenae TaxID=200324 RepID=A0A2N5RU23_9BASI|nr:hypothetical protein PCASD_26737 [Puccinia coronata f. sp. avenae]
MEHSGSLGGYVCLDCFKRHDEPNEIIPPYTARKPGSDGCIRRPGRLATEFESVSDSLSGARPSLNRMAASDINSDAAIRARFSGSSTTHLKAPMTHHQAQNFSINVELNAKTSNKDS